MRGSMVEWLALGCVRVCVFVFPSAVGLLGPARCAAQRAASGVEWSGSRFGRGRVLLSGRSPPFRVYFLFDEYIYIYIRFLSLSLLFPFFALSSLTHSFARAVSLPILCLSFLSPSLWLSFSPSLFSVSVACLPRSTPPPFAPFVCVFLVSRSDGHRRFRQVRPGTGAIEPRLQPEGGA